MPSRRIVSRELAEVFKVIAHPDRIRLIEELRRDEKDVSSLAEGLDLPGPRVSQHLSVLRTHRIVEERRDGRRHLYRLVRPEIAGWIVDGVNFLEGRFDGLDRSDLQTAKRLWSGPAAPQSAGS